MSVRSSSGMSRAPFDQPTVEPLDLRLAAAAVTAWVTLVWGIGQSTATVVQAAVVIVSVGLLELCAARRGWVPWYAVAFAAFAAAVVLCPLAVRIHQARDSPLSGLAASRVEVTAELVVTGDPHPLTALGPSGASRSMVEARLTSIEIARRRTEIGGAVLVLAPSDAWRGVLPGQHVRLDGRLSPPLGRDLIVAALNARTDPELIGRPPWWQRGAGAVRVGLRRAASGLPAMPRGLLPGLVDGDTSELDPVLAEHFRVAGLTHLVAVSGTNCSILIGAVALVLRRLRASPRLIAFIGGLVLVGFVIIARPSPSVLRAAVMAGIALAGLAAGRQRSAVPALAASVLILLGWQPALAVDLGFALSVSATAALLLIAPTWVRGLHRCRVPAGIAEPVAVAAAAHLATAPIVVGISGQFSLVAIPANMLAEPVVAAATVLGVLAAVASVICMPIAVLFAQLAGWPCRWLVWVAEYFGTIAGATLPWPAGLVGAVLLILVTLSVIVLMRRQSARLLIALAAVVALLVQLPVRAVVVAWPPAGWLIVACDVGQGDALAIAAGRHQAVVVDAGPDPIAVDRCLHELGVTRIPLLILSHSHLDHVGGISGVLHDRRVEVAVTSPLNEPLSGHRLAADVLARTGVTLREVGAGTTFVVGPPGSQVRVDVLGPSRLFQGTRSDPNNNSVVLRVTVSGRRILMPGDAEVEAQDELLAAGTDLHADILKVPHHGSAYSDPAFLNAVHASIALVSVGRDNDYGHPSPLLIAELARLGVPLRRTDLDGDIAVVQSRGRLFTEVRAARTRNAATGAVSAPRDTMCRCRSPPPSRR
jgi:competence protein ComEC